MSTVGLEGQSDTAVWEHARDHDLIIVSKDRDFADMSGVLGHPPKVLFLRVGNAGTTRIAELLTRQADEIRRFAADGATSVQVLQDPER